jgi:hypothetical protein
MKDLIGVIVKEARFEKSFLPIDLACLRLFVCPQIWKLFVACMKKHYESGLLGQGQAQANLKKFNKSKAALEVGLSCRRLS